MKTIGKLFLVLLILSVWSTVTVVILYKTYTMGYGAGFDTCTEYCEDIMKEHMEQYHPHNIRKWAENKDHYREKSFKARYGLSVDDLRNKLEKQNFECLICGLHPMSIDDGPNAPNRAHVDHCHKTGIVRDLLCSKCNWMLGSANDNCDILRSAIRYLEAWSNGQ